VITTYGGMSSANLKNEIMEGMTDWNKLTMEQYIEHLEEKFKFDSSGTAKAVFELINAYKALLIQRVSSSEAKLKFNDFVNKQQDLDSEFVKIVNDNFWDLL